MDCVEYNPTLDSSGQDKAALLDFFRFLKTELQDAKK